MVSVINALDIDALRERYETAEPFPFFFIDGFLEEGFAHEVARAFPCYAEARGLGHEFDAVNEKSKIQITARDRFPEPVKMLGDALNSPGFLEQLQQVTGINALIGDPLFAGGGMHMTGPRGRLDVHVDFNYLGDRQLHRRLNILIYLNEGWNKDWGGDVELWDRNVRHCFHSFSPIFNRCVVFETSEISFHGVTSVKCPRDVARKSFAAYYYTRKAPHSWDGQEHSTVFRARPDERLKRFILMPAERVGRSLGSGLRRLKRVVRGSIDRP